MKENQSRDAENEEDRQCAVHEGRNLFQSWSYEYESMSRGSQSQYVSYITSTSRNQDAKRERANHTHLRESESAAAGYAIGYADEDLEDDVVDEERCDDAKNERGDQTMGH